MESTKTNSSKRDKALNFLAIFLVVFYVVCVVLSFAFNLYIHKIWFSFALGLIGLYLVTKALFFHLDSDFLWGLLALFFGTASGVFFFWPSPWTLQIYFALFSLACLLVYFVFRQNFYLILFALALSEVLLLGVFKHSNPLVFWLVQGAFLVVMNCVFCSHHTAKKGEKTCNFKPAKTDMKSKK